MHYIMCVLNESQVEGYKESFTTKFHRKGEFLGFYSTMRVFCTIPGLIYYCKCRFIEKEKSY